MECRSGCGACCIAPSINTPFWGMPEGKKAGEVCANLNSQTLVCKIWGTPNYPETCQKFSPSVEFCGASREEALQILNFLESDTLPKKLDP